MAFQKDRIYFTDEGIPCKIYEVYDNSNAGGFYEKIHGAFYDGNNWISTSWSISGSNTSGDHEYNLVDDNLYLEVGELAYFSFKDDLNCMVIAEFESFNGKSYKAKNFDQLFDLCQSVKNGNLANILKHTFPGISF